MFYPVEKRLPKFYKYKILDCFLINIEATNKLEARGLLRDFILKNVNYSWYVRIFNMQINELIRMIGVSEAISHLVTGESTKFINNIEFVWDEDKWMPLFDYKKRENIYDDEE